MKACLKADRARIQVGRISSFGLMEMSRQRLRVGVLESSTNACPHCEGSGVLRSEQSQSLHILRIIEEEGIRAKNSKFTVYLPSSVAVYILNNKRSNLLELEKRYDFSVTIAIDNELTASAHRMEKSGKPSRTAQKRKDSLELGKDVNKLIDVTEEDVSPVEDKEERNERPKRRRRRRRNQNNRNSNYENDKSEASESNISSESKDSSENAQSEQSEEKTGEQDRPRRRRRPNRGRRNNHGNDAVKEENKNAEVTEAKEETPAEKPADEKPAKSASKKAPKKEVKAEKPVEKKEEPKVEKPKKKGWWSR